MRSSPRPPSAINILFSHPGRKAFRSLHRDLPTVLAKSRSALPNAKKRASNHAVVQ